jgi:PAS domain S-box-containing protein
MFGQLSPFVQYGLAALAVTLAALATEHTPVIGLRAVFLLFIFAILQCALWFGLRPGFFAFALSLVAVNHFFLLPVWTSAPKDTLILNMGFSVLAVLIIGSAHLYRRSRARLERLDKQSQAILNSMAEGVHVLDTQGKIIFENPAASRMFGWDPAEILGKPSHATIHHTHADGTPYPRADCPIYKTFQDGVSRHVTDETFWRKNGTGFPVEYDTSPLRNEEGELLGTVMVFRDVTERRRFVDALLESMQLLRLFIEHAPAAIAMFDQDMRYLAASTRWRTDFRLDSEVIGRSHYEIFPEIPERWREVHRRALAGEVMRAEEDRFDRADGSTQWLRWEVRPWQDSTEGVAGIIILSEDITARKQAEVRVRESEERYRHLVENSPDGIFINQKGRFVYVNPALCRMLGARMPEQLLGRTILDHVHPSSHEIVRERMETLWKFRQAVPPVEEKFIRLDGQPIDVECQATYCSYEGQPGMQVIVRDMTGYERAQAKKFHALLESAPDAMVMVDGQGMIVLVNAQAEKLFDYPRQELLGQPIERLIPECFQAGHVRKRATYSESPVPRKMGAQKGCYGRRRDGSILDVDVSLSPIATDEGLLIASSIRDVTEHKQMESQIKASNDALRKLSAHLLNVREEERARIARDIHDELGGTLTAVKMDLSHIKKTQANGADLTYSIQLADAAVQALRRVITDLRPSVLDNLGLWAALEWLAQDMKDRTGIHCQTLVDDSAETWELPPDMATSIFRIVQEALTNVARHAQASEAWVRASRTDGELTLEIEDNGRGITEAEINRPEAWGLIGMSERVRQHNGRLSFAGKAGDGTLITLRIPVGNSHDKPSLSQREGD